jgi:hypothetical protein
MRTEEGLRTEEGMEGAWVRATSQHRGRYSELRLPCPGKFHARCRSRSGDSDREWSRHSHVTDFAPCTVSVWPRYGFGTASGTVSVRFRYGFDTALSVFRYGFGPCFHRNSVWDRNALRPPLAQLQPTALEVAGEFYSLSFIALGAGP